MKVNKVTVTILDNWGNGGRNLNVPFDKLSAVMSKADVDAARAAGRIRDTEDGLGFVLAPAVETVDATNVERRAAA